MLQNGMGGGGQVNFYPYEKREAEKVLAMLTGGGGGGGGGRGYNKFWGSFFVVA